MPKPEFLRRSVVAGAAVAGVALAAGAADAQSIPVRVTAEKADSALAPLSLVLPQSELLKQRVVPRGAALLSFQSEAAGAGKVRLTFIAPALKKGESKLFVLVPGKPGAVEVKEVGKNAEIKIAGQLFTRYDTTTGPNKPYLYPIQAFGGKHLTRRWPLEDVGHEEKDHPHHRGLWFTHGEMNGIDFWTEAASKPEHLVGKTVNTGYSILESGAVYGKLGDAVANRAECHAQDLRGFREIPVAALQRLNDQLGDDKHDQCCDRQLTYEQRAEQHDDGRQTDCDDSSQAEARTHDPVRLLVVAHGVLQHRQRDTRLSKCGKRSEKREEPGVRAVVRRPEPRDQQQYGQQRCDKCETLVGQGPKGVVREPA